MCCDGPEFVEAVRPLRVDAAALLGRSIESSACLYQSYRLAPRLPLARGGSHISPTDVFGFDELPKIARRQVLPGPLVTSGASGATRSTCPTRSPRSWTPFTFWTRKLARLSPMFSMTVVRRRSSLLSRSLPEPFRTIRNIMRRSVRGLAARGCCPAAAAARRSSRAAA